MTEDSRDEFLSKLDELSVSSSEASCIGCGLSMAAQLLSPRRGGHIIVTSAGPNKCQNDTSPLCVSVSDAVDLMQDRGIRVDTYKCQFGRENILPIPSSVYIISTYFMEFGQTQFCSFTN